MGYRFFLLLKVVLMLLMLGALLAVLDLAGNYLVQRAKSVGLQHILASYQRLSQLRLALCLSVALSRQYSIHNTALGWDSLLCLLPVGGMENNQSATRTYTGLLMMARTSGSEGCTHRAVASIKVIAAMVGRRCAQQLSMVTWNAFECCTS
jgi:hypothetical protein